MIAEFVRIGGFLWAIVCARDRIFAQKLDGRREGVLRYGNSGTSPKGGRPIRRAHAFSQSVRMNMSLHPNEEPSQSNGIFMDLILSICGLATSLLTAVLLWVIESKLEFRAHSFMILFILPVGALISGFIAASGYYLGARLFHCRPTAMLTLGVLAVSVGTYFAIHYFSFRSLEIEGTPLSDYISFGSHTALASDGTTTIRDRADISQVKVGLNYRFGPTAVVAKY